MDIRVKQFKDKTHNWWVGYKHYTLVNGKPMFVAGGVEDEKETEHFIKYLKNKKLI